MTYTQESGVDFRDSRGSAKNVISIRIIRIDLRRNDLL